jgi:hypothetical protein
LIGQSRERHRDWIPHQVRNDREGKHRTLILQCSIIMTQSFSGDGDGDPPEMTNSSAGDLPRGL